MSFRHLCTSALVLAFMASSPRTASANASNCVYDPLTGLCPADCGSCTGTFGMGNFGFFMGGPSGGGSGSGSGGFTLVPMPNVTQVHDYPPACAGSYCQTPLPGPLTFPPTCTLPSGYEIPNTENVPCDIAAERWNVYCYGGDSEWCN